MSEVIACPVCGSDTTVTETRSTKHGLRRRRHCLVEACGGRLTTLESVVDSAQLRAAGRLVLVPLSALDSLIDQIDGLCPRRPV